MEALKRKWHRYHYKNLTYLIASILVAMILFKTQAVRDFLLHIGSYGYLGAFIAGILFVSTFTVSFGTLLLLILSKSLNPLEIAILAGTGAVFADLTIFHFVRSRGLVDEIKHFFAYFGGDRINHLIHTKYFGWTLPVIGALIIASPLPDELGVSLLGISKMKTADFTVLSFILNSIGILCVVSAGRFISP